MNNVSATNATIYGLVDPRTQQLRYVGKTITPLSQRLSSHIYCARRETNYRAHWIRSLLNLGLRPEAFVIETVAGDGCEEERHHIAYFKSAGCALVNGTAGGEGSLGMSAESRAKISAAHKGKKLSESQIAEIRARVVSKETLERLAAARRGHRHSEATKEKMRAHRHSDETKARMSVSQKARGPRSEETRERMRLAWVKRRAK